MRVKIWYEFSEDPRGLSYWAKSLLNDKAICTCGASWAEARQEHMKRLSAAAQAPEPPMEETVEV